MSTSCLTIHAGELDFVSAWDLQKRLHQQVVSGELPGVLLLLEHPHVYTLGRRGKDDDVLASPEKLLELGAEVHFIDRGGEATYHGPGQLVGYPIINLRSWGGGPKKYVNTLERVIIETLAKLGIQAESEGHPTGVWAGNAKIAAIGVRISNRVTMHGFALNVDPDLSYFEHIVPCGIPGSDVTSISHELSRRVSVADVIPLISGNFEKAFGVTLQQTRLQDIDNPSLASTGPSA